MADKKHKKEVDEATEDWHRPKDEEELAMRLDDGLAPTKHPKPPKRYEKNFLVKLDNRTEVCRQLKTAYAEITADCGGDTLSHIQLCLCERFVFLEFILQQLELKMAQAPKESAQIMSRWIQACNSIVGIGKTLGLERRVKKVVNLETYVKSRR
jgi:hypothetical protein